MFKKKTVIVALFADTHPNSTVGLVHPDGVVFDDGGKYVPSRAQQWLWRRWVDFWKFIADLKKKHRAEVWAICLGDGVDDNSHSKHGLIAVNKSVIVDLAAMIWEPVVADLKFVVRGTESHTGGSGELEELIAKEVGAEKDTITGNHSWWWLPLEAAGVTFDLAHHPASTSMRPWTKGGGALRVASIMVHEYAESGNILPQFGIRAHVHHLEDSGLNHKIRVLFLPPWQLCTAYGHRLGFSGRLEPIGGMAVVCKGGYGEVHVQRYRPTGRAAWTKK